MKSISALCAVLFAPKAHAARFQTLDIPGPRGKLISLAIWSLSLAGHADGDVVRFFYQEFGMGDAWQSTAQITPCIELLPCDHNNEIDSAVRDVGVVLVV